MSEIESNVVGVVLPGSQPVSDAIDARALALLADYLRRAPDRSDAEDIAARDAFVTGYKLGYRRGGREASESWTELCTALSDRRMQTALAVLLEFVSHVPEPRSDDWRQPRRV